MTSTSKIMWHASNSALSNWLQAVFDLEFFVWFEEQNSISTEERYFMYLKPCLILSAEV